MALVSATSRTLHVAFAATLASLAAISCVAEDGVGGSSETWQVGAEPAVVVGSLGSGPESSLYIVNGAVRLSDGRIVVANAGTSELRVFSPEGRHLRSIGREGDGPGEFRRITSLQRGPNDSLFAFDLFTQRLSVFSGDGGRARTATFHGTDGVTGSDGLVSVLRLADGVWVGRGHETLLTGPPYEIVRDTIVIGLMDGELGELAPVAYLPGLMGTVRLEGGRRAWRPPAFSPRTAQAVWGRCVFVSTGESRSVSVFSSGGERVATFEGPGSLRPVTEEHVESWIEYTIRLVDVSEDRKARERRHLADYARPTHLPYYRDMVADEWGHIWLQEYSSPSGWGRRWYVLSQSGELLGEVMMPKKRMRVFEISEAGVLARTVGELDQEMLELFPLTVRPSSTARPLAECTGS